MTSLAAEGDRTATAGDDDASRSEFSIGPIEVTADAAEADAFRRATSVVAGAGDELPFTFPMRWLAHGEIRAAAARVIGDATGEQILALHESQTFDYAAPLKIGETYRLTVKMRRSPEAQQIIMDAEIGPNAELTHLRMEMILRLVAIDVPSIRKDPQS
jgi:hypothetical protein